MNTHTVVIATDVAPLVGSLTGAVALAWAAFTWTAQRRDLRAAEQRQIDAQAAKENEMQRVNILELTHRQLSETLVLQHEDNERTRKRNATLEAQLRTCARKLERLVRLCAAAGVDTTGFEDD